MNSGDEWCGSIFTVHTAHILLLWKVFLCHNWKLKGLGCDTARGFDVSFGLGWKNRHMQHLSTQIRTCTHQFIHPHTSVVCSIKASGCSAWTPCSRLLKLASISVGSVQCIKCIIGVFFRELSDSCLLSLSNSVFICLWCDVLRWILCRIRMNTCPHTPAVSVYRLYTGLFCRKILTPQ